MIRVEIRYLVSDRKDKKFRAIQAIADDIESEFWTDRFFSEASEYCIIVEDEKGYATRESRREKQ